MRTAPFPPAAVPADLWPLRDGMAEYIEKHLKSFVSEPDHSLTYNSGSALPIPHPCAGSSF